MRSRVSRETLAGEWRCVAGRKSVRVGAVLRATDCIDRCSLQCACVELFIALITAMVCIRLDCSVLSARSRAGEGNLGI